MKYIGIKSVAVIIGVLLAAAAFAGQPFTFLFFNDFHARLEPFVLTGTKDEVGGLARLAGLADQVRAANDAAGVPTFLLVAGDVLQGTPYSTVYKGAVEFECLNQMRVTAICLGNHEFDYGQENLKGLIAAATFPVLSANTTDAEGEWSPFTRETTWLQAGDKKILVIGLTTPEAAVTTAPKNVVGLAFHDPVEVAERLIDQNKKEADAFVAVTHLGFDADVALAKAAPELDVIVGGHSHTKVDKPEMVGKTAVVSAYEYGEYLGRLDGEIEDGRVEIKSYALLPVTAAAPADAGVAAVIAKYKAALGAKLDEVVGSVDVVLSYKASRSEETNFGDVVADVMREAGHADVALFNAGGMRADLGRGNVTTGNVLTALPFGSEVVVLEVPGSVLRAALDFCAREKVGQGGFLQISGFGYTLKPGAGSVSVLVGGKPLADAATYKVAMPDFLASGGDGYSMFVGDFPVYKTGALVNDLVVSALRAGRALSAEPAGRIKIVSE